MRLSIASTSVATILALSAVKVAAQVQQAGDPVTYTNGGVVYTAVLDPDLDTVSDRPVSTIAAGGAGAGAAAGAVVTTVDANGNPITISNGVTLGAATTTSPVRTTAVRATTTTAAAVGGGVSISDDNNNNQFEAELISNNDQDDQQSPPNQLHFQKNDRRSLHTASPDQPKLQRRQVRYNVS